MKLIKEDKNSNLEEVKEKHQFMLNIQKVISIFIFEVQNVEKIVNMAKLDPEGQIQNFGDYLKTIIYLSLFIDLF